MSSALVVAHPGHELRVFGWLVETRPVVHVLTDGSGRGAPRLHGTEAVLSETGARRGSVFGRFSDREAYALLLEGRLEPFLELARELSESFARDGVRHVVADARDGYNPMHDVARMLAETAARLRGVPCDAFTLVGAPGDGSGAARVLPEELFRRKMAAARAYPMLDGEVAEALGRYGESAFRVERISPAAPVAAGVPFYERHGERRVAEGSYREVLRYSAHVRPLEERLATLTERCGSS